MFTTIYLIFVYLGLLASAVFVVGWTSLFFNGRVNPDRVPYTAASIIDFIGLPVAALLTLALTAYNVGEHGVVPPLTLGTAIQRVMLLGIVDALCLLRVGRFVAAYRAGRSPRVVGAPTPGNDPLNHGKDGDREMRGLIEQQAPEIDKSGRH